MFLIESRYWNLHLKKNFEEDFDYFTYKYLLYNLKNWFYFFFNQRSWEHCQIYTYYTTFVLNIGNDIWNRKYIATRIEQTDVIKYLLECKFFRLEYKLLLPLLLLSFFLFFLLPFFLDSNNSNNSVLVHSKQTILNIIINAATIMKVYF